MENIDILNLKNKLHSTVGRILNNLLNIKDAIDNVIVDEIFLSERHNSIAILATSNFYKLFIITKIKDTLEPSDVIDQINNYTDIKNIRIRNVFYDVYSLVKEIGIYELGYPIECINVSEDGEVILLSVVVEKTSTRRIYLIDKNSTNMMLLHTLPIEKEKDTKQFSMTISDDSDKFIIMNNFISSLYIKDNSKFKHNKDLIIHPNEVYSYLNK